MRLIQRVSIDGDLSEFGGRSLRVTTREGSFMTPLRAATSTDFNYKADLPLDPPLDSPVAEVIASFPSKLWDAFLNTNGSFASRVRTLSMYSDMMQYSARRFFPKIPRGTEISEWGRRQLVTLQHLSNIEFTTLPPLPGLAPREHGSITERFAEDALSCDREPLVYLNMGDEPDAFREKFDALMALADTDLVRTVGLVYRPLANWIQNYRTVWEHRDRPVLLQMSGVKRMFHPLVPTSTVHLLQKWCIDAFGVGSANVGGFPKRPAGVEEEVERLNSERRFDESQVGFIPFSQWRNRYGEDLHCTCPVCRGHDVGSFLERYSHDADGEISHTHFMAGTRLHEFYASSDEFSTSRRFIRDGDLQSYFAERPVLNAADAQAEQPQERKGDQRRLDHF